MNKIIQRAIVLAGSQAALAKRLKMTQPTLNHHLHKKGAMYGPLARKLVEEFDGQIKIEECLPHLFDGSGPQIEVPGKAAGRRKRRKVRKQGRAKAVA